VERVRTIEEIIEEALIKLGLIKPRAPKPRDIEEKEEEARRFVERPEPTPEPTPTPRPPPPPEAPPPPRDEPSPSPRPPEEPPRYVDIAPPPSVYYTQHSMCVRGFVDWSTTRGYKPPFIELYFTLWYFEDGVLKVYRAIVDTIPLRFDHGWGGDYYKIVPASAIVNALNRLSQFESILRMNPQRYEISHRSAHFGLDGVLSVRGTMFEVRDYYQPLGCRYVVGEILCGETPVKRKPYCCAGDALKDVFSPCYAPAHGLICNAVELGRVEDWIIPRWCYEE